MTCSDCGSEVPSSARFCIHCGHTLASGSPLRREKIDVQLKPTSQLNKQKMTDQEILVVKKTATLAGHSANVGSQTAFRMLLASGDDTETILFNLLRHQTELRWLLEELISDWPSEPSEMLRRALTFLQSHCSICGRSVQMTENLKPICGVCYDR